jgi:hypothetical protein
MLPYPDTADLVVDLPTRVKTGQGGPLEEPSPHTSLIFSELPGQMSLFHADLEAEV